MDINYIELAKKNRTKALAGLRKSRGHFSVMSQDTIQSKSALRTVSPFFISVRNSGALSHASLH